jgi:hypothetical protein
VVRVSASEESGYTADEGSPNRESGQKGGENNYYKIIN